MSIKRYDVSDGDWDGYGVAPDLEENQDGRAVLFSDHEAALAEKDAEIERIRNELRQESFKEFLEIRGIDTPCKACGGMGVRSYGCTSTWKGGIGGQMITPGTCDKCWGSGDANSPGVNLRQVVSDRTKIDGLEAALAEKDAEIQRLRLQLINERINSKIPCIADEVEIGRPAAHKTQEQKP